jgi:hypothetical protein
MSQQGRSPARGTPHDEALQLRHLRDAWRRAALLHDFDEVEAIQRADEPPVRPARGDGLQRHVDREGMRGGQVA